MMTGHRADLQGGYRPFLAAICSLAALFNPQAVSAQEWPARTIAAIVPFAAGSASDVVPRLVLEQVSRQVGQTIIVENRPGAGGTLGANVVAKAQPDGYTMLATGALPSAHALYPTLPYATLRDFVPVMALGQQPLVLVTAPSKGFKTLGDLIAAHKAKPGSLNYASAGVGSPTHLGAERVRMSAGLEGQHIPFKGSPEAITDVLAGRVDFYLSPIAPVLPLVKGGKLVALSVSTSKRATALPQVPTTAEAGLADAGYDYWVGVYLPAKTPRDIVVKLHREAERAQQVASVRDRLTTLGVEPTPMSLDQFDAYFRDQVAANVRIVKAANIPAQR
jgi:tripartite-type tricarboxylate transporter receptor subunit TctC